MTRACLLGLAAACIVFAPPAGAQDLSAGDEVEVAVLPLPTSLRSNAGVFRWTGPGQFETLRPSRNGMSCMADNPSDEKLDVRCYRDEFWAVIRRFGELRRSGMSGEEADAEIRRESVAGELALPQAPAAGYRMLGPIAAFDAASHTAGPEIHRWQSIHFPFRTAAEIGLTEDEELNEPDQPGQMPYVMASGTWWSHVMIVHEPFE